MRQQLDNDYTMLGEFDSTAGILSGFRQAEALIQKGDQDHENPSDEAAIQRGNAEIQQGATLLRGAIQLLETTLSVIEAEVETKRKPKPRTIVPVQEQPKKDDTPKPLPLPPVINTRSDGCPLPTDLPLRTPIGLPIVQQLTGGTENVDWKKMYVQVYPEYVPFYQNLSVHHAVPRVFARQCGQAFSWAEINSMPNYRGICIPWEQPIHDAISKNWTTWIFSKGGYSHTFNRQEVIEHAHEIDLQYGKFFYPRLP
jgi:hypothetical protein